MRRLAITLIHLLSLPTAVLLAIAITVPQGPAIDIHLADTYFVAAHFHTSILLGCCILVVTLVSYRYRTWNWGLKAAWGLLAVHVLSALLLPFPPPTVLPSSADVATFMRQSPLAEWLYVVSAIAALVATLSGLLISLSRSLQFRQTGAMSA